MPVHWVSCDSRKNLTFLLQNRNEAESMECLHIETLSVKVCKMLALV